MDQASDNANVQKKKTLWQLFTNDGRFDSKLPPYQRLLGKSSPNYSTTHRPRPQRSTNASKPSNEAPKANLVIPTKPQPKVTNVENYVIIWLQDNPKSKQTDSEKYKVQLRAVANTIKSFQNTNDCLAYMSTITNEKIFLIVSGTALENLVSRAHNVKQLEATYIFCSVKLSDENWINEYPEVRGIYKSITVLCEQLKKDTTNLDRQFIKFELMQRSISDVTSKANQQDAQFMYDQLFRDIILAEKDEDMQDLYDFSRKEYFDNPKEQKFIMFMKTQYTTYTPAYWYIQDAFLYRMLNKALRTHQYDTLYVMRVFIRHLHQQLVDEQNRQGYPPSLLFRGQAMDMVDFEKIRQNEGGLLSVFNFLSTSADREVAVKFASASIRDRRKASILMEIKVENNTAIPIASISEHGVFMSEKEWLFSMGSVFRIGSLVQSSDGFWILKLTLTNDHDELLTDLKNFYKKSMQNSNNCWNFAGLMHKLAALEKSEYFYLKALQTETAIGRRSVLINNLGLVKSDMGHNDQALEYLHESLKMKDMAGLTSEKDKATSYNNIAAIYAEQSKIVEATQYYKKAMEACQSTTDPDQELLATLYNNLATIYNREGNHEEALKNNEECLKIRLKLLPKIHPDIASAYNGMAMTLHRMGSHKEAVQCAQKAVEINKQALPADHPQALLHMRNLEVFKASQQEAK